MRSHCSTLFLFQSNPTLLLANCCLKCSDCLSSTFSSYSTTQTPSFNLGSPLLLWGPCEWQLSGGGIHMKPFHQCRPVGPAWLTAAQCKSSAIMESYCCIYTGEMCHFFNASQQKIHLLREWTESDFVRHLPPFLMSVNRAWGVWYEVFEANIFVLKLWISLSPNIFIRDYNKNLIHVKVKKSLKQLSDHSWTWRSLSFDS